jgi:hypothetical protein
MPRISFTEHPASVGESYAEHFAMSWGFGFAMLRGGLACLVHGIFPFLCTSTGSGTIRALHERMVTHRVRDRAGAAAAQR